jgi:GGDEF domain-containing protein
MVRVPLLPSIRRPPATSESNRARRFALPSMRDDRTESSIEAFLDGPEVRRGRPRAVAATTSTSPDAAPIAGANGATGGPSSVARRANPAARRPTELRTLPGRLEWNAAMARESARAARYRRPASVAIVELRHQNAQVDVTPFMKSLAGPISRVLREDCRSTDLVARVATSRFQLLLPETNQAGAERLADRLATSCRTYLQTTGSPLAIRVSFAGAGVEESLEDALAHALRAIEAA